MNHTSRSTFATSLLIIGLLCGAFTSSAIAAPGVEAPNPSEASNDSDPESESESQSSSDPSWLSVRGALGVALGQSLFREDPPVPPDIGFEPTSYWSVSYLVVPEATLGDFDLSLGLMLEQRMSDRPDAEADFGLGETLFNVRWQGYVLEDIGLSFSPTATVVFPTSELNDHSELIFATELALDVRQRLFDVVALAANVGWRKNMHSAQSRSFRPSIDGDSVFLTDGGVPVAHPFYPTFYRGGASSSRPEIDGGSVNTSSLVHLGLGLEVLLPADLAVEVGYSLYTQYLYDVSPDSSNPDLDKLSVATLDLRYSPLEWLSLGAGTATTQPTHTPDNRTVRFPFWDFSDYPGDNSVIRVYAIGRS